MVRVVRVHESPLVNGQLVVVRILQINRRTSVPLHHEERTRLAFPRLPTRTVLVLFLPLIGFLLEVPDRSFAAPSPFLAVLAALPARRFVQVIQ